MIYARVSDELRAQLASAHHDLDAALAQAQALQAKVGRLREELEQTEAGRTSLAQQLLETQIERNELKARAEAAEAALAQAKTERIKHYTDIIAEKDQKIRAQKVECNRMATVAEAHVRATKGAEADAQRERERAEGLRAALNLAEELVSHGSRAHYIIEEALAPVAPAGEACPSCHGRGQHCVADDFAKMGAIYKPCLVCGGTGNVNPTPARCAPL